MKYVFIALIIMSASGILWAAMGPLKQFHGAPILRIYAVIQYIAAGLLFLFGK